MNASQYLQLITFKAQSLATHQSTLLFASAAIIFSASLLYLFRGRLFGYYYPVIDQDGGTTGEKRLAYRDGYYHCHRVLTVLGLLIGGFATYAGLYLGWNGFADPLTLILLFIGGASSMHIGGRTWRWAWLLAPVLAGIGISELWGLLQASPDTIVTLGGTVAVMIPTFLLLLYVENAHAALGDFLVRFRLAFLVAGLMVLQGVCLAAGVSLWLPIYQGVVNMLLKLGVGI